MYRSLATALALVVLLAGCNAPVDSTPQSTLTPVEVPATPEGGDRTAPGELAPGVEASGVTDPVRLARAHAAVLARSSYTVNQTLRQTYVNGTVESRYVTRAKFADDPTRFATNLTQTDRLDGELSTRYIERFADGTRVYESVVEPNETRYRVIHGPSGLRSPAGFYPSNFTNEQAIARLFTLVRTNTTDRWIENGTEYLRVESRQSPPLADLPPLQNVTIGATVTESGLVTDYQVEYDVVRGGAVVHVVVDVTYTDIGSTTVSRPDWLDRVNATS